MIQGSSRGDAYYRSNLLCKALRLVLLGFSEGKGSKIVRPWCRMKEKSVSVIGSMSLSKDGSKEEFRDMKDAFTDRGSFQERQGTATQCMSLSSY